MEEEPMIRRLAAAAILVTAVLLGCGVGADAAEIKVLCANGMKAVLTELQPQFERTTGHRVTASFGEAGDLRKRIQGGEVVDVIVLPRVVLDQLLTQDKIVPGTTVDLGQSGMGLGVRTDAPKPDIGSAEGLKRALLAAKSIAITDPATGGVSGVHIAEVFQRLGIAEELQPKLRLNRGGPNAAFVARGEADMAIQLAHEIRAVPGIDFIPLPVKFQRTFVFSAGLAPNAKESVPAKSLLQFLSGQEGMTVIRAKGMDPVVGK
jgi:molybdate transport system substrate-binding protein